MCEPAVSAVVKKQGYAVFLPLVVALAAAINPVYAAGDEPAKISDIVPILENIIKLLAPAAGIAFLVMLLIGGFQFINSGGDPKATGHARTTLTFAIIGIILVVVSWLILLVIQNITSVDVTTVDIPTN